MATVNEIAKDMAAVSAGTHDKMEDESSEPNLTKTAGVNTPTKPRAAVGQPDTPNTANSKKTRTTVFITSAQADAGKTAAQRCELTHELVSAAAGVMDKVKSSPIRPCDGALPARPARDCGSGPA